MIKMAKVLLVVIMIVGVLVSIFNFISINLTAVTNPPIKGYWQDLPNGKTECIAPGEDCDVSSRMFL